jgi:butyryl-CoA dehydrogenase
MDLRLTEDQQFIRKTARDFAEKTIKPTTAERDRDRIWPAEIVKQMGELGFLGVAVSEEYGGAGLDYISYAIIIEELSRVDAACGVIASVNNSLVCHGIESFVSSQKIGVKPLCS